MGPHRPRLTEHLWQLLSKARKKKWCRASRDKWPINMACLPRRACLQPSEIQEKVRGQHMQQATHSWNTCCTFVQRNRMLDPFSLQIHFLCKPIFVTNPFSLQTQFRYINDSLRITEEKCHVIDVPLVTLQKERNRCYWIGMLFCATHCDSNRADII